ncbi:hypothetical protein ACN2XU_04840 [Primorskyibacter sp. 2E107]|uniref:hypothetical protein n=1 Tax=Primorskyibacter sp. 2E107 TaxID=3403458 RepID=UPI003AF62D27
MFLELITVFIAGFAGAGVVLALTKISGGRLPKWLVPVGAGAAMLLATVSLEYSWSERTRAGLPDGTIILSEEAGGAPWRPWSYVIPLTDRFWSVDTTALLTNSENPDRRIAKIVRHGRWARPQARVVAIDCAQGVWAEGEGDAPVWQKDSPSLPIVARLCTGG